MPAEGSLAPDSYEVSEGDTVWGLTLLMSDELGRVARLRRRGLPRLY